MRVKLVESPEKEWPNHAAQHGKHNRVYQQHPCVRAQPTGERLPHGVASRGIGADVLRRVYSQRVNGVPPEQVVGPSILTKYEYQDGKPVLMREPKLFFIGDNAGKPIGINLFIGKRPYAAFGNSPSDKQMLEWTQAGDGARLMMVVLHDNPVREYAYGPAGGLPDTKVGAFKPALYDEAKSKGWNVISMKNDWKRIFTLTNDGDW